MNYGETFRTTSGLLTICGSIKILLGGLRGLTMKPVAYFSGVDVDRVMRKDPGSESVTPSNPQGLEVGCGIPKGESLTVEELLEKTGSEWKS